MTNITIYDTEAKRLNEAAKKVGESVAAVIEWLVEENLDDLVDDVLGKGKKRMYKVGDRFIIEIEEVFTGKATGFPQYRIKGFDKLVMDDRGLMRLSKLFDERSIYDKGYNRGLNDAWDAIEKIIEPAYDGGYSFDILHKIFGESAIRSILKHNTAAEALAKIKSYEDKQKQDAEIKVGDEVYSDAYDDKGIVTYITADKVSCVCIICNGYTMMKVGTNGLHKTGRHFDAIAEVLKEMRGAENDE